jgi:hypothetical protein
MDPHLRKMYVSEHTLLELLKSIPGHQVKDPSMRDHTVVDSREIAMNSGSTL